VNEEQRLAAELQERAFSLFQRSLHIRTFDSGSCAVCESEIRLLAAPHYDLQENVGVVVAGRRRFGCGLQRFLSDGSDADVTSPPPGGCSLKEIR